MTKKGKVEQPEPVEGKYCMYILICSDSSYYCGTTNNLQRRLRDHEAGIAARWTKKRLPVQLVYTENYQTLVQARRREVQVKGWTRKKKEKLISGVWNKV